jgi:tetratricopeptide (TPR) repeat protein
MRRAALWVALLAIAGPAVTVVDAQGEAEAVRLLAEADALAAAGEDGAAAGAFEALAAQWPESEAAGEALVRAARLRLARGEPTEATADAQQVVEKEPRSPRAAAAQLILAEVAWAGAAGPETGEEALVAFQRVWALFPETSYPDLEWRSAARVRAGELEAALERPDRALAAYLDVIEREPPSAWRVRAHRLLAEVLFDGGAWEAAVESLQEAIADAGRLDGAPARAEGEAAARRLAAMDRLVLRPLAGLSPWTSASSVAGLGAARPQGIAVSDDGLLVVADGGADTALVQLADGTVRRMNLRGMQRPAWSAGRAWVPSDGGFVTSGQVPRLLRGASEPKILVAAAAVPFGWAMATAKPDLVLLASNELRVQRTLDLPERCEPIDVAADGHGRIMVLDGKSHRIVVFDSAAAPARSILAGKLDRPQALAIGPLGHLFVLDRAGRVTVADRTGEVLATVGPALPDGPTLTDPRDLAVDGAGRLFVSDAKLGAVLVLE